MKPARESILSEAALWMHRRQANAALRWKLVRASGLASLLIAMAVAKVSSAECNRPGFAVLTYHRFDAAKVGPTTITPENALRQWHLLQQRGYQIVPLSEVETAVGTHHDREGKAATITIDDGHVSIYTVLFPLVKRQRLPVTLFIYPSIISRRSDALTWSQLLEMQSSGLVRIESHTYWHPNFRNEKQRLSREVYDRFALNQLTRSKALLEQKLGIRIRSLAWPYGIYDRELETVAKRAGYDFAYAFDGKIASAGDDPYAIHRIPVPNVANIEFIPCDGMVNKITRAEVGRR